LRHHDQLILRLDRAESPHRQLNVRLGGSAGGWGATAVELHPKPGD
jgi:hypothetical protein